MGAIDLEITIYDERFGSEVEHDIYVTVHTTPGEPATNHYPGCEPEWEVTEVRVGEATGDISKHLSADEWEKINEAVAHELEMLSG